MSPSIIIQSIDDLLHVHGHLSNVSFALSPPLVFQEHVYVGLYTDSAIDVYICIPYSSSKDLFPLLFEKTNGLIFFHAFKELCNWFYRIGVGLPTHRFIDVSIAAYLLNPPERDWDEDQSKFLLAALVHDHLGETYPFLPLIVKDAVNDAVLRQRVCGDAHLIWAIATKLIPEFAADSDLHDLFKDVEMPLVPILAQMEREGIGLRKNLIDKARQGLQAVSDDFCHLFKKEYGLRINPLMNSDIEIMKEALSSELKNAAFNYPDKDFSDEVHPYAKKLVDWQRVARALSFVNQVYGKDRCHPTWRQTATSTGRIVCSEPAVQNIPRKFRHFLKPDDGGVFLKADFSAFQLRLLAHLSQDSRLMDVFKKDKDPHTETMKLLKSNGILVDRRQAKAVNFCLTYGGTAMSLSDELNVSLKEGHRIFKKIKNVYPALTTYLENVAKGVAGQDPHDRKVTSIFGRRRLFARGKKLSPHEKRQVSNAVVQMLEADIFKKVVLRVHQVIGEMGLPLKIRLLLHDGIWFTCPKDADTIAEVKKVIQEVMESTVKLSVPLKVKWE